MLKIFVSLKKVAFLTPANSYLTKEIKLL